MSGADVYRTYRLLHGSLDVLQLSFSVPPLESPIQTTGWELIDSHGAGTVVFFVFLFTAGRGKGTETCEMDNVFPPDDP